MPSRLSPRTWTISSCTLRISCSIFFVISNISYWVTTMITSQNIIEYFSLWTNLITRLLSRQRYYEWKTSLSLMVLLLSTMVNQPLQSNIPQIEQNRLVQCILRVIKPTSAASRNINTKQDAAAHWEKISCPFGRDAAGYLEKVTFPFRREAAGNLTFL